MKTILFTAIAAFGFAFATAAFAEGNDMPAPRDETYVAGGVRQDTGSEAMPVFEIATQRTVLAQGHVEIPTG